MADSSWGDIYKELGAKPVINAIGSVTLLGGSTPIPEVKEAMEAADRAYIPLVELEEKAGQAIADMIDVPAAYITAGAGSALTPPRRPSTPTPARWSGGRPSARSSSTARTQVTWSGTDTRMHGFTRSLGAGRPNGGRCTERGWYRIRRRTGS